MMNRRVISVVSALLILSAAAPAMAQQESDISDVYIGARGFWGDGRGHFRDGDPNSPTPTTLDIEKDLAADQDILAGGLSLGFSIVGGYKFHVESWSFAGSGQTNLVDARLIGINNVPTGSQISTDIQILGVSVDLMTTVDVGTSWMTLDAGLAIKGFTIRSTFSIETGPTEDLNIRSVYFPAIQLDFAFKLFGLADLHVVGGAGLPVFTNGNKMAIRNPGDLRAGVRFNLKNVRFEGGFQVNSFEVIENENDFDEERVRLVLSGIFAEMQVNF